MGRPEMAGKHKNQIRARPAAVGREILRPRSFGGGAPPCMARV